MDFLTKKIHNWFFSFLCIKYVY